MKHSRGCLLVDGTLLSISRPSSSSAFCLLQSLIALPSALAKCWDAPAKRQARTKSGCNSSASSRWRRRSCTALSPDCPCQKLVEQGKGKIDLFPCNEQ